MYSEESIVYMEAMGTGLFDWQDSDSYPAYHPPNFTRFFPYRMHRSIYDMLAYLYHRNFMSGRPCSACTYNYSGHRETIERGRCLFSLGESHE